MFSEPPVTNDIFQLILGNFRENFRKNEIFAKKKFCVSFLENFRNFSLAFFLERSVCENTKTESFVSTQVIFKLLAKFRTSEGVSCLHLLLPQLLLLYHHVLHVPGSFLPNQTTHQTKPQIHKEINNYRTTQIIRLSHRVILATPTDFCTEYRKAKRQIKPNQT
jgi:hypothetical protein